MHIMTMIYSQNMRRVLSSKNLFCDFCHQSKRHVTLLTDGLLYQTMCEMTMEVKNNCLKILFEEVLELILTRFLGDIVHTA